MPLHLAARLHAFVHGVFKPSDVEVTRNLYDEVRRRFQQLGLDSNDGRNARMADIATDVLTRFGHEPDHPQFAIICELIAGLFQVDDLFVLPEVRWHTSQSVSELWAIRDRLNEQRQQVADFSATQMLITETIFGLVAPIYHAYPSLLADDGAPDGIAINTNLLRSIGDVGAVTQAMLAAALADELSDANLLPQLQDRLQRNVIAASGGNPIDPTGFNRQLKLPAQSDIKTPEALVQTYLGGTPLVGLFRQSAICTIPTQTRYAHQMLIAGSGHGKTQTLQFQISQDIAAMEDEDRTVIVLDSQGDLIRTISNLAIFGPNGALHDRLIIIDPTDVEWPVSLNLFDVGMERLNDYPLLERERLTNSILELYDFVLGTLLSAEMTQKQNVIFRYVTRLMLHIPDATIHTLLELMEPNSQVKFAEHIAKLTGTAKHFFETEFSSKEFEQTKKQVLRRLWGILENQTFERMFSHPRSKLDLFTEMNAGKVILINTAKDLLKETGTEIFGRFFIALIAQAAQERAALPTSNRTPTFVYVDELADYVDRGTDRNLASILAQARKYNVGMVVAAQFLGQLDIRLQDALAANTAIKFAGGVSAKDARALAPMLYCEPSFIEAQPKGSFAAYVKGATQTALPLLFPLGHMERMPTMNQVDRDQLQNRMREGLAVHYTQLDGSAKPTEGEENNPEPLEVDLDPKQPEPPAGNGPDATPEL